MYFSGVYGMAPQLETEQKHTRSGHTTLNHADVQVAKDGKMRRYIRSCTGCFSRKQHMHNVSYATTIPIDGDCCSVLNISKYRVMHSIEFLAVKSLTSAPPFQPAGMHARVSPEASSYNGTAGPCDSRWSETKKNMGTAHTIYPPSICPDQAPS